MIAAVILAIVAGVYWRLRRTNMVIPPRAEIAMNRRDALRFGLENNLI